MSKSAIQPTATGSERAKRSSTLGIKILNDEKISPLPAKGSTLSISKPRLAASKKGQEHYVLQSLKSESKKVTGGANVMSLDDDDTIIVLAENNDAENAVISKIGQRRGEITEEFHISGEEGDGENDRVKEIVEHICGKCYKTFRRLKSLIRHLEFCRYDSGYHLRKADMIKNLEKIEKDAAIMEKKDICFCCSESYDTFHLGHINCPDCPKSFKSQESYERHIFITHSEFNDYPCSICNAKLRSNTLLKLHEEQHKNRGKPFACKICGKDFTRSYHLKRHQKYSSCSTNENNTLSCKVCDKVFYRLDNLRSHLKQHIGTQVAKKPEYMCHVCKNCFYSLSTLNIHIRTHTGEKPFACDLCDKKFSALVALKKHRRYHTGEKPYTCTVCNQSFAVKEVLNRHMKRHTGERPHKCDICEKSFIQATQLRTHSKTHLRPFSCSLCEDKFKTQKQLDRHVKEHSRSKRNKKKTSFSCTKCKLTFSDEHELDEHIEKGEHKEPAKRMKRNRISDRRDCAICDKIFDTTDDLRSHILKVHECDPEDIFGEKPPPAAGLEAAAKEELNDSPSPKLKRRKTSKKESPVASATSGSKLISTNKENGLVVREFLVDEVPAVGSSSHQTIIFENETYTVFPVDNDLENNDSKPSVSSEAKHKVSPSAKKEQRKSLAASLAAAIADNEDDELSEDENLDEMTEEDLKLKDNVVKLLDMLVDNSTLKKFGWPGISEEVVLCKVIENCGHELSNEIENNRQLAYGTRVREYLKLLFRLVIHNDSIKELLNNYPIDEVIEYVLGNDDEEDDDEDVDKSDANGNDEDEEIVDSKKEILT